MVPISKLTILTTLDTQTTSTIPVIHVRIPREKEGRDVATNPVAKTRSWPVFVCTAPNCA